ncbi:MAG: hypothetical protein AOA65_1419 [Candidatus Bathyarchaeota archaeon BA1]|nr:MAG: hypothetical protein AOA65_1419 [Candidatus Bathyarchaeota archaeon BA1]
MSSLGKVIEKIINRIKKTEGSDVTEAPPASITFPPNVYLKALSLRNLEDVDMIKREVKSGSILILKVTPLAKKSVEDVKRAVGELCEFIQQIGGDIARLGEERVVITPPSVRIWRGKPVVPKEEMPTAV